MVSWNVTYRRARGKCAEMVVQKMRNVKTEGSTSVIDRLDEQAVGRSGQFRMVSMVGGIEVDMERVAEGERRRSVGKSVSR